MKTIAFHSNQLGMRGTEVALYDYAKYNEDILGNKSLIMSSPHSELSSLSKFKERFNVELRDFYSYQDYCNKNKVDYLYIIKAGGRSDGICLADTPCLIHAVFRANEPHGHKYFYVSDWLARDQGYDAETHGLNHIVPPLRPSAYDLRDRLGIPESKTVFGCYGGSTEFNINFVHQAIKRITQERDDIVFLFMNINEFCEKNDNIIHLPGTWVLEEKTSFIEACDVMLHARSGGETFGCAVAEFSMGNKPVITYNGSGERCHIEMLGERGIYYNGYEDLYEILTNIHNYIVYDDYYKSYNCCAPEIIMDKFNKMFLT
jgi:hypothetical protein